MTGEVRAVLLSALAVTLVVAGPATALHGVTSKIDAVSTSADDGQAAPADASGTAHPSRGLRVKAHLALDWAGSARCLQHQDAGLVTDGDVHPVGTPVAEVHPPISGASTHTSPDAVDARMGGEHARAAAPDLPGGSGHVCRSASETLSGVSIRLVVHPTCVDAPMDRSKLCAGVEDDTVWVNWSAGGRLRTFDRGVAAPGTLDAHRSTGDRPGIRAEQVTPRSGTPTAAATSSGGGRAPLPGSTDDPIWMGSAVGAAVGALAVIWLYRRLSDADILEHDLRSKIIEIAEGEPGIHVAALADRLDVAPRTVHYHVRVLEEAGHIVVKERGGQRMVLTAETATDRLAREAICALRQDGKRELLRTLASEPDLSLTEVAHRIDRHPSTVKRHADDLVERGLVEAARDGAARRLRLVDAAAAHVRHAV